MNIHHAKIAICGAIGCVVGYVMPIMHLFILLLIITSVEYVTKLWAANMSADLSLRKGLHKLRKLFYTLTMYVLLIWLLFNFEDKMGYTFGSYSYVTAFIWVVELMLTLRNMAVITGKSIFVNIVKLVERNAQKKYGDVVNDILKESINE